MGRQYARLRLNEWEEQKELLERDGHPFHFRNLWGIIYRKRHPRYGSWIAKIEANRRGGKATGPAYRSALEMLLESFAPGIDASNDPQRSDSGAPENVWEVRVGGYHACDKWLKDRKGRKLANGDIAQHQCFVVELKETARLLKEIDAAIPKCPLGPNRVTGEIEIQNCLLTPADSSGKILSNFKEGI